jgi:hypothetical protein
MAPETKNEKAAEVSLGGFSFESWRDDEIVS